MTPQRAYELEVNPKARLTQIELDQGWHFCADWDFMLVGPDTPEWECCTCIIRRLYEKTKNGLN